MRFSEWLNKIQDLQAKLEEVPLYSVSETIVYDNKVVTVSLGKESGYKLDEDENWASLRFLRGEYTKHKKEFDILLEALTASTQSIGLLQNYMMNKATEEAVPGAVLDRLSGNADTDGDSVTLLINEANRVANQILEKLMPATNVGFVAFEWTSDVGGKPMVFQCRERIVSFSWGTIMMSVLAGSKAGEVHVNFGADIEQIMLFLANAPLIQWKAEEFAKGITGIYKTLTQ